MEKVNTPEKSYENLEFLNSDDGRVLRIGAEYLEPKSRFLKYNIYDTIVFFGSARIRSRREAEELMEKVKSSDPSEFEDIAAEIRRAEWMLEMSRYYEDAVELSRRLTEWSMSQEEDANRFIISTGGGPGIMEAANKGATEAGGYSIGLGISLPHEQGVNRFVPEELAFEFHYFFMRKFFFAYLAKGLVIFPGGFGTMDELFELLTLLQTRKMEKKIKIVIYDAEFWKEIVNFDALVRHGVISQKDLDLFTFCETPQEAFEEITQHFEKYFLHQKRNKEEQISLIMK